MGSPKEPPKDSSDKTNPAEKKPPEFENLVEELKNVLAGLNKPDTPEPTIEIEPAPADDILRPRVSLSPPLENEPERLGDAAFKQASEAGSPTPSDADFWKGNVLGWPETPSAEVVDNSSAPPLNPPPVFTRPPEPVSIPTPPPPPPAPMSNPFTSPEEVPILFQPTEPKTVPPPVSFTPLVPTPPPPQLNKYANPFEDISLSIPPSSESPTSPKVANPFEDVSLPPPPLSPLEQEHVPPLEIENLGTINESETSAFFDIPPISPKTDRDPKIDTSAQNQGTILPSSLKIPIPGTLFVSGEKRKENSKDLTLHEMQIKQSNVIQVACLFPESREGDASDFISSLKSAAAKSPDPHTIETVLVNPWFQNQVDIYSWKKAASISGAHFLFVLAWRKDKDFFKDLSKVIHQDEVKARVVLMEQIKLRTLYADLLADILRTLNVKS